MCNFPFSIDFWQSLNYYPRWMVEWLCHILMTQPRVLSTRLEHKSLGNPSTTAAAVTNFGWSRGRRLLSTKGRHRADLPPSLACGPHDVCAICHQLDRGLNLKPLSSTVLGTPELNFWLAVNKIKLQVYKQTITPHRPSFCLLLIMVLHRQSDRQMDN